MATVQTNNSDPNPWARAVRTLAPEARRLMHVLCMLNSDYVAEDLFLGDTRSKYAKFRDRNSLLSTFSDISRHQFGACDPQGQPYLSVHRQYQRNLLQTLCLAKDETADAFAFALEAVVLKTKHSCATANLDHLLILAKIYQSYKPGWDLDITILRSLRNILAELLDHGLSRHAQYISGLVNGIVKTASGSIGFLLEIEIDLVLANVTNTTGIRGRLLAIRERERVIAAILPHTKEPQTSHALDNIVLSSVYIDIAANYAEFRDAKAAKDVLDRSSRLLECMGRETVFPYLYAAHCNQAAYVATLEGNFDKALQLIRRSIDLVGKASPLAYVYQLHLAGILVQLTFTEEADNVLREIIRNSQQNNGMNDFAAEATLFLGVLSLYHKDHGRAKFMFQIYSEFKARLELGAERKARALHYRSIALIQTGDVANAERFRLEAEEMIGDLAAIDSSLNQVEDIGDDSSRYERLVESRLRFPVFNHKRRTLQLKTERWTLAEQSMSSVGLLSTNNIHMTHASIDESLDLPTFGYSRPQVAGNPPNTSVTMEAPTGSTSVASSKSTRSLDVMEWRLDSFGIPSTVAETVANESAAFEALKTSTSGPLSASTAKTAIRTTLEVTGQAATSANSSLTTNLAAGALGVSASALGVSAYSAYNTARSTEAAVRSANAAERFGAENLEITRARFKMDVRAARRQERARRAKGDDSAYDSATSSSSSSSSNDSHDFGSSESGHRSGNVVRAKSSKRQQSAKREDAYTFGKSPTKPTTHPESKGSESNRNHPFSIQALHTTDPTPRSAPAADTASASGSPQTSGVTGGSNQLSASNGMIPTNYHHKSNTSPKVPATSSTTKIPPPPLKDPPPNLLAPCTHDSIDEAITLTGQHKADLEASLIELEALHLHNEMENRRLERERECVFKELLKIEKLYRKPSPQNQSLRNSKLSLDRKVEEKLEAACDEVRHRHDERQRRQEVRSTKTDGDREERDRKAGKGKQKALAYSSERDQFTPVQQVTPAPLDVAKKDVQDSIGIAAESDNEDDLNEGNKTEASSLRQIVPSDAHVESIENHESKPRSSTSAQIFTGESTKTQDNHPDAIEMVHIANKKRKDDVGMM